MTKEEASIKIGELVAYARTQGWDDEYTEAFKVFEEQEPILDKIKVEITNIPITDSDGHFNNWYREPQAIINDVLRIIDKYKAKSKE